MVLGVNIIVELITRLHCAAQQVYKDAINQLR
jgi:hypothetical protein